MKNQRGITLIALVITIVVMLILAGVTVNVMLTDGVVSKSAGAQKEGNKQAERERLAVYIQGHFLNNYGNTILNDTEEMDFTSISPSIVRLSNESGKQSVKSNINSTVYGDGYLYLPSGSTVKDFGTVEFSYALNENTGDLYALDPVEYSISTNE